MSSCVGEISAICGFILRLNLLRVMKSVYELMSGALILALHDTVI